MRAKTLTPIRIQAILLLVLLSIAPFALSLTAYDKIGLGISLQADPKYWLRVILIFGGLTIAVISVILFFKEFIRKNDHQLILHISITLCSFTIGWLYFPFWVNGVYQAYQGNGPDCTLNLYDPGALIPAIYPVLGFIWHLIAFFTLPVVILSIAGLLFFALEVWIVGKDWKQCVLSLLCLTITSGVCYWFSDCATWVVD